MSIKISHALCAMLLQMTVLLQPVLNSTWSTPFSLSDVKQQGRGHDSTHHFAVIQTSQHQSAFQFKRSLWLSVYRFNLNDPWSCSAYVDKAFALFNDIPTVFMHVYLQMLGLKLVFQQLYFALQRYALVVMSRQPLPRFNLMR